MRVGARLIVFIGLLLLTKQATMACEIKFSILGEQKEAYSVGDVLVVEVKIVLTHKACQISIQNETEFKFEGIKVLGATPWKETQEMTHTRKIKLEITDNKKGISKMVGIRTCDKEGGSGSIVIPRTD